jgi:hypothetical protein
MISAIRWVGLLVIFICAACSDGGGSGGSGGSGGGGSNVSNDPGRDVKGCFDCDASEYCLVVSGASDAFHCAKSDCNDVCSCLIDDGESRLEICGTTSSCQDGSGILYCFDK